MMSTGYRHNFFDRRKMPTCRVVAIKRKNGDKATGGGAGTGGRFPAYNEKHGDG